MITWFFAVAILGVWIMGVRVDFRRDPGAHVGVKIAHVAAMMLLLPRAFSAHWVLRLNPFAWPGLLGLASMLANVGALFLLFGLCARRAGARRAALAAYPALGILDGLAFSYGFMQGTLPTTVFEWALLPAVCMGALAFHSLAAAFYSSTGAQNLFALGPLSKQQPAGALGGRA